MTLRLNGSTSGYVEIDAPATAGSNTLTLPDGNGTSGQVLSTDGSGALSFVDRMTAAGPTFSAYLSSGQTVSDSTWTKVELDTEHWDTNSNFDNATNYRFTPTVAGYYQINFSVGFDISCTRGIAAIYKNGAEIIRSTDAAATQVRTASASGILYMNGSSDYLELYGYLTTSNATRLFAGHEYRTVMSAALIRPA